MHYYQLEHLRFLKILGDNVPDSNGFASKLYDWTKTVLDITTDKDLYGVEAYALDSTPADCVRYAILGRKLKFDLVISGINRGLNVGMDMLYSGTVAAICEAANLGVPALAFSTTPTYYDQATKHLDMAYNFVVQHNLLEKNLFYNINIPAQPVGIRITRQGGPYFSDDFTLENGMVTPHGVDVFTPCGCEEVDTDCVLRCGMISITPLTNCRVNMALYNQLRELNP